MEALKHNFLLNGYFKKRGYEDSAALTANSVASLPKNTPVKSFDFSGKQLFDNKDSAKLKNQKLLDASGQYLAQNQFGLAVIVVSAGREGDTQQELVTTQARAAVVRKYLADNFGFDDTQLKTFGTGKQTETINGEKTDSDGGSIQIIIYPIGTVVPVGTDSPADSSSTIEPARAAQNRDNVKQ
jgi:hypothetical protein